MVVAESHSANMLRVLTDEAMLSVYFQGLSEMAIILSFVE